jgi:hypothetical protein
MNIGALQSSGSVNFTGVANDVNGGALLLASQVAKTTSNISPEKKLMMAMLFRQLDDILSYHDKSKTIDNQDYIGASAWLSSTDGSDLLSFESICEKLGFDSDWIRGKVAKCIENNEFCFRRMFDD